MFVLLLIFPDQQAALCNVNYGRYLYFYEKGVPQITVESVESLIKLIKNEESMPSDPSAESFFATTLEFMEFQKQKEGAIGERYQAIKV